MRCVVQLQDGGGAAAAVDLTGCQQACEMAQPECDAIVYNSVLQACFLKSGPSGESCQVGLHPPCQLLHDHYVMQSCIQFE